MVTQTPKLRYTQRAPCPICNGWEGAPRGSDSRCWGFRSADGEWARCTRDEHAGNLTMEQSSKAYVHRLVGDCNCGTRHDPTLPMQTNGKREPRRIVATSDYTDESGITLFQVLKYNPKGFSQRQRDGDGWKPTMAGARLVPYRLPDLIDTTRDDRTVFVVEGEKDADRLAALGLIGTCNPMGAGKWRDELSVYFMDRNVVILPDNDDAGRKHAQQVAAALHGIAASVRVVELPGLPAKGDVSDWLDAGNRLRDLRTLVEHAPRWEPTAEPAPIGTTLDIVPMSDVQSVDVDWLWHKWLARGKLALIGGHAGDGKSFVTTAIAAIHSTGGLWPDGGYAPIGNTLFLIAEDALDDTLKPRLELHGADSTHIFALRAVYDAEGRERGFNLAQHLEALEAAIVRYRISLLVIDPLSSFMPGSDRNGEDVRDILIPLARLLDKHNVAGLGVMHVGKGGSGGVRRAVQMFLGATAFGAVARVAWGLAAAPTDDDPNRRVLGVVKTNLSMKPDNLAFTRTEDGPVTWRGTTTDDIEQLLSGFAAPESTTPERADIVAALNESATGLSPLQVADMLGKKASTVRNLFRKMEDAGDVVRVKTGIYTTPGHRCIDSVDSQPQESTESMKSTHLHPDEPRFCDVCDGLLPLPADRERGCHSSCAERIAP